MRELLKKLFNMHPLRGFPSVVRIGLNRELHRQFARLKTGVVMDVGAKLAPYKNLIPATQYLRLDIDPDSKPDICSDLHDIQGYDNYFDTVIATEVLEHLYNPQLAINQLYKILKPGGVMILSTRFIHRLHPDPQDYYRFTPDSFNYLMREFSKVEIFHHGNRLQTLWYIFVNNKIAMLFLLPLLNHLFAMVNVKKTDFPLGYVVYAVK